MSNKINPLYYLIPIIFLVAPYATISLTIGLMNAATDAQNCNYINGDYNQGVSDKYWVSNPATIGLTGECRNK